MSIIYFFFQLNTVSGYNCEILIKIAENSVIFKKKFSDLYHFYVMNELLRPFAPLKLFFFLT